MAALRLTSIRVDPAVWACLDDHAQRTGRTRSALVRAVLEDYVERHGLALKP